MVVRLVLFFFIVIPVTHAEVYVNNYYTEPPGRLVDIGGYQLHISCLGKGSPTVILDAGIGGFSLDWISVQRALADKVQVCAYDRAGYGWSDPGPSPRSTDRIVDELHRLLINAGLQPPYVLVGHSFGGYNVQYYAKLYPGETAGLVLVDSSHPQQAERLPDIPAHREKTKGSKVVTLFRGQSSFKYYPEDVLPLLMHVLSWRKMYITQRREFISFTMSGDQVEHSGELPDMPLVVITRGKRVWPEDPYGNMLESVWSEMQRELSNMTPSARQIIALASDHLIHLEQPRTVASAIMSVIEDARRRGEIAHCPVAPCPPGNREGSNVNR
ncbi:MAG TPA: alpha/beta hydrolase [Gammaproteobacteria bacterium]|nr:alpha/beta hydrolase [Gammaproteobacteria bacterium]